jgi:hypothetical protein
MKATPEEHKSFIRGMYDSLDYGLRLREAGVDFWTAISSLQKQIEDCRQLRDRLYPSDKSYYHGHVRGCEEVLRQIVNKNFLG